MKYDIEIDTKGLKCPLPVLRARKRLKSMAKGQTLSVWADDPAAVIDFPHFCAEQNLELLVEEEAQPGSYHFVIKAG